MGKANIHTVSKFCIICFSTWKCLPASMKVGNGGIKSFYKEVCKATDAMHKFRWSVAAWILANNTNWKMKLRKADKHCIADAQTLSTHESAGLRRKQNLVFIEIEQYRADIGEPSDNGHNVDKHVIDGIQKEGCWVSRDKKGYHNFEAFEESAAVHQTVLDDGKSVISATQVKDKHEAVSSQVKATAKRRREQSESSFDALLKMAQSQEPAKDNVDSDLRLLSCDLRLLTCDLGLVSCDLRLLRCDLRRSSCDLGRLSCDLGLSSCDLGMFELCPAPFELGPGPFEL